MFQLYSLESVASFQHIKSNDETIKTIHQKVSEFILSYQRYSDDTDKQVLEQLKKLKESSKSALNILEKERKQIVEAFNFNQGHWFKCPKGHIYVITECGGAMQVGKCNECGAEIGGNNHRLLSDNSLASEMDGARHAAWSEGANLANFDLNDLQL